MNKDYLSITVQDNDFCRDLLALGISLSYEITKEHVLDNECVNLVTLENYILDIMISNYTLSTFGKTGYPKINEIKEYFKNNLKVYYISKDDVIENDSEILYLCVNKNMRECGEYFVI